MGFYFSPRGGSAQVARYLCRALQDGPWAPALFTGSLGLPGEAGDAPTFFGGAQTRVLDYSAARWAFDHGDDPMKVDVPMHASFEDKSGVPDRIFFALDDLAYRRQVRSWVRLFGSTGAAPPEVIHLHHLTPMHEAARQVWPGVPIVTHLHGTELKMLDLVRQPTSSSNSSTTSEWTTQWIERIERWASDSARLVVGSPADAATARRLLPVDPDRVVTIANGVDTAVFTSRSPVTAAARRAAWKHWLIDDPQGWKPGDVAGSIRYDETDLQAFADDADDSGEPVPVVLFAGRFMKFKRVQLLIEAHHAMRCAGGPRSVLVVAGGYPGEWEGEHPFDTVARLGAEDVFFVGWRGHDVLAEMLRCCDVFAAPSVDEPFGLVYLEAMAAGVPPIATATGGPVSFVNVDADQPTGWLVAPDDVPALADALAEAVNDPTGRQARGRHAARFVRAHYSWTSTAIRFAELYRDVVAEHDGLKGSAAMRHTASTGERRGVRT